VDLAENSMLGPYRVVGILGEGGMGAVYRAQDTRLGRDVAIKVLTAVTLNDQEKLQRFEQEARTTGMLNHPNLLTVYDVGNHDGTPYLVTELLEGETLRDRLTRGAITPRKTIEIASQIANGLAAAHEKGIVHRDLKPENIFGTRDGRIKILDFGIAKLTRAGGDGPTFQMAATEPGMVLGTVGYMSPEQVRGEAVDQRSDIFAFGTIVYEMLTGSRAFKRNSSIETLSAILKEEPPEIADVAPNVPQSLDRLVRRCMEKDRELRFQTARDLAFNLETMGTTSQAPSPIAPPRTTPQHDAATATMRITSAATAVRTAAPRPRQPTISRPLPKKRTSAVLLALLYIVSVAGAAFAAWYLTTRMTAISSEPVFHRMTFRRGEVRAARFAPDGDTIVYSAAWDGRPSELFVGNRQSPDARPMGIADAEVMGVSKNAELAILLHRDRITNLGTLARVPLAGGIPHEIADGVAHADWSPDGTQLAIIRQYGDKFRLEYPIGTSLYETPHDIRDARISPDGNRIAFIEPLGGENAIAVVESGSAPVTIAHGWSRGASGLAWRPDGKEIWFTGTATSAPPALYAVTLDGDTRLVSRLTGSMKLWDVARNGDTLLSNGMWRTALQWQAPGESVDRDISWFDWSALADLSNDGKAVLFSETREGGGATSAIYIRHAGDPAPVRIGDGYGDALSPDGHWVLAHSGPKKKLAVLPTGTGEPRELKVSGTFDLGAQWFPDSRRVIAAGMVPEHGYHLWVIDTLDETAKAITPENIWGSTIRPFAVSPDGRLVAGMTAQQTIALYDANGAAPAIPVNAAEKGEVPITFSPDGAALYVYKPTALPAQVTRIELATGARSLWKEFSPADPAGIYKIAPVAMTPDASAYAYNAMRMLSDLYVAENLR
jgi:serine/threonine protein kinase